nr:PREDICTED: uncharacterized protein C1orf94 homolog isoform X2 [Lepisosteus oculatus]
MPTSSMYRTSRPQTAGRAGDRRIKPKHSIGVVGSSGWSAAQTSFTKDTRVFRKMFPRVDRVKTKRQLKRAYAAGPFPRSVWIHDKAPEDDLDKVCYEIWKRVQVATAGSSARPTAADRAPEPTDLVPPAPRELPSATAEPAPPAGSRDAQRARWTHPEPAAEGVGSVERKRKSIEVFLRAVLQGKEAGRPEQLPQGALPAGLGSSCSSTEAPAPDSKASQGLSQFPGKSSESGLARPGQVEVAGGAKLATAVEENGGFSSADRREHRGGEGVGRGAPPRGPVSSGAPLQGSAQGRGRLAPLPVFAKLHVATDLPCRRLPARTGENHHVQNTGDRHAHPDMSGTLGDGARKPATLKEKALEYEFLESAKRPWQKTADPTSSNDVAAPLQESRTGAVKAHPGPCPTQTRNTLKYSGQSFVPSGQPPFGTSLPAAVHPAPVRNPPGFSQYQNFFQQLPVNHMSHLQAVNPTRFQTRPQISPFGFSPMAPSMFYPYGLLPLGQPRPPPQVQSGVLLTWGVIGTKTQHLQTWETE